MLFAKHRGMVRLFHDFGIPLASGCVHELTGISAIF
jgi:hypothetical protein